MPESRIISVADVIESMSENRPYRISVGLVGALDEIRKGSGKLYDTEVARIALQLFEGQTSLTESKVIGSSEKL